MGKDNDIICSYLGDNERFADLFNGSFFGGRQIVKHGDLMEASEVYTGRNRTGSGTYGRTRDLKKRLKNGMTLNVLAVEAQGHVDYSMPWRCMNYDNYEYERQLKEIRQKNRRQEPYGDSSERLCRVRKTDLLIPAYTLCLYHGSEPWDGPRSLKEMMAFGENREQWQQWFADYPVHLVCVNEWKDCSLFKTPLRELFRMLPYRKDKKGLNRLLEVCPEYGRLDEETAETLGQLMGMDNFMDHRDRYKEEGKYNMCQALRELMEDSRNEGMEAGLILGKKEGKAEGKAEGEKQLAVLMQRLFTEGRVEEARLAAVDEKARKKLYSEFRMTE